MHDARLALSHKKKSPSRVGRASMGWYRASVPYGIFVCTGSLGSETRFRRSYASDRIPAPTSLRKYPQLFSLQRAYCARLSVAGQPPCEQLVAGGLLLEQSAASPARQIGFRALLVFSSCFLRNRFFLGCFFLRYFFLCDFLLSCRSFLLGNFLRRDRGYFLFRRFLFCFRHNFSPLLFTFN